ncbi:thioredoxin domain-containing protein [Paraliomyxa miuraensis]|uniref:thioredoxin domain-containing protein n=1 Tax=Paraliomyxa miuraensis TaxID=376150 RepID=UPI00225AB8C7|nr:thioredoxin domain-containing protein [Paraliomyxa miuraensis]MCX4243816.1 thioredoxin domain-containing protein [Paraliomyxa miuraensis]
MPNDHASRRFSPLAHAVLALALVGLGTSVLLLVLHLSPEAGSCGPGGGCDLVRTSRWSMPGGVPLPVLGIGYFAALALTLLVPRLHARWWLTLLGVCGVATGLTLLALQGAVIGAWCPYCVVVDVCSLGAGLAALLKLVVPRSRPAGGAVAAALGLGAAVPLSLVAVLHEPEPPVPEGPAPEAIAAVQDTDRITIVDFIDLECPFCRRQHARLAAVLQEHSTSEPVELVYKHVPLSMHPNAREAARYACCAEEQGKGDAMIDALFAHDELSSAGCLECAQELGLDQAALQECLSSTRPDERLEADSAEARAAKVRRLPTCFIGEQRFEGLQAEDTLRQALDRAAAAS